MIIEIADDSPLSFVLPYRPLCIEKFRFGGVEQVCSRARCDIPDLAQVAETILRLTLAVKPSMFWIKFDQKTPSAVCIMRPHSHNIWRFGKRKDSKITVGHLKCCRWILLMPFLYSFSALPCIALKK